MEISENTVTLKTLLASYPHTAALKDGVLHSPLVNFEFSDVNVAHRGFKDMVREMKYDAGQLALVTFLQAKAYGKPYSLMPAVVVARGQHHIFFYNPERGELKPGDLRGKRVGVRSYTQTTGAWVRGFLEEDYGVGADTIRWITLEDAHVAEYQDPPWVERAADGKTLQGMLLDGEIDAAILEGSTIPDSRLKHVFPDAKETGKRWAAMHGGVPINHMMVVRNSIVNDRPDVVRDFYRLLIESRDMAPDGTDVSAIRFGIEAVRASMSAMIEYAVHQELIPRSFEVDELFEDVAPVLGLT